MGLIDCYGHVLVKPFDDLCDKHYIGGEVCSVDTDITKEIATQTVIIAKRHECQEVLHGVQKWYRVPLECVVIIDGS
jgi:hypothetical protein